MEFLTEIYKMLGLNGINEQFKVVLFDNAGYFENVRAIRYYKSDEIALILKNGEIKIKGEGLEFKKFCEGDTVICGKIKSIERI